MLSEKYDYKMLSKVIVSKDNYHPFPTIDDRAKWNLLLCELKENLIKQGEKYLNFEWPLLPAVRYMDFVRNGNRTKYQRLYHSRRYALGCLVIAECIENEGRFIDDIINGIWCICEESSWVIPAHNNHIFKDVVNCLPDVDVEPFIDLFSAETGALMSWTYYLLKSHLDKVSPLVCKRIEREVKLRILDLYLKREDYWWMGFLKDRLINNWNPWCNSNCLAAFLLVEKDNNRRIQAIEKCMKSLDKYIATYHSDGGCDEGTTYWRQAGGSLFDCLELLYGASNESINVYDDELIKNIGQFIYLMHISKDYFVNFADGAARIEDLPAELIYRYGYRIGDTKLSNMAVRLYDVYNRKISMLNWYPMFRILNNIFNHDKMCNNEVKPSYVKDVWMKGIQVMTSREREESDLGFYLAAKGGHNNESHNHNDIGQFIVYYNGDPVIIDIGVETYTAKTFSSHRYEIWTMQSAYHNLPTVNGVQQEAGKDYKATDVVYNMDDSKVQLSMNIDKAYPDKADIDKWKRIFKFDREGKIEIIDDFVLNNPSQDIKFSLLTPCEHDIKSSGIIVFHTYNGHEVSIKYDELSLTASSEKIEIQDNQLKSVWGEYIYRIVLKSKKSVQKATWMMKIVGDNNIL